jgi:prolyl-tRNA synthetase
MGVNFTDDKGEKKPVIMGCYGIGVGRLMATIAEVHHDEKGLKWPESVSPFSAHVLALQPSVLDRAKKLADKFAVSGSVLLDDRDVSPGQKFAESDLLGISKRFVVSERNMASGQVEEVNRISGETKLLQFEEVVGQG